MSQGVTAVLGDAVVGGVDCRHLLGGEVDEFLGHAGGDQAVGVIVADQLAVGGLDRGVARLPVDAEDAVRVGLVGPEMAGADALEIGLGESEYLAHPPQVVELRRRDRTVRLGDVEQPIEQLLQHRRAAPEHAGDLPGVGLEPVGVGARPVEQAADVALLVRRHAEGLLEGVDLVAADHAVGLGHLGAEHDDGDGEGDLLGGRAVDRFGFGRDLRRLRLAHRVHRMPGDRAQDRAERPAEGEAGGAAQDLAPNAHAVCVVGCARGIPCGGTLICGTPAAPAALSRGRAARGRAA
jgi:hypothetical protein